MSTKPNSFTPGPWHVGSGQQSTLVYSADGWAVANATVFHGRHPGEAPANACAIAALPDLVAALFDCAQFIENVGPDDPQRNEKFFAVRESWRNAFTKVRGES